MLKGVIDYAGSRQASKKQAGRQASRQASRQAGRQASRQACRQQTGRQGGKQASKQAGRQASTRKAFSRSHALEGLVSCERRSSISYNLWCQSISYRVHIKVCVRGLSRFLKKTAQLAYKYLSGAASENSLKCLSHLSSKETNEAAEENEFYEARVYGE